jgi:hypothetical protein
MLSAFTNGDGPEFAGKGVPIDGGTPYVDVSGEGNAASVVVAAAEPYAGGVGGYTSGVGAFAT